MGRAASNPSTTTPSHRTAGTRPTFGRLWYDTRPPKASFFKASTSRASLRKASSVKPYLVGSPDTRTIGSRIRAVREKAGLTQAAFGVRLGHPGYRRKTGSSSGRPRDHPDSSDPLTSPADRAAPGCARRAALRPCRLPSATACGRHWCSTTRGPSSRRSGHRCARPDPWRRSPSGMARA